ncbi:SMC-Scp complex subunit ScpB [Lysobacter solisilvae (ex Woo and Kim 2022)]|uniref:SMC-Scp complex subunit ScpB n=1 Tax=Agrilutibacter terrestris TaxID=2865112 RepID=A0A7H0FXU9_9GAMM|nr:SMC-Scp complex subunit ScpB [Lysobacter terrestris]QNP40865.1 SMC-Scp complex subunit ScpB [Lysobacter terrestris]
MDQDLINRIIEGALLAANQPLTLAQLHSLFPEDQPAPNDSVEQALEFLREDCANRGVELVELASGFRYQVKADVHAWVSRLWTERKTKYTRATLETLALIAYRQPITRGEIEQVRGVAVSSNIIQALEEREWIRVVGHRDVPGKPALFGTTKGFLDYFGLKRLDELPPLSELKDIGELEPQLQFDNVIDPTPIEAGGLGAAPGVEGDAANGDELADNTGSDELSTGESEDNQSEGIAADDETTHPASDGEPEAATGESAADENDPVHDDSPGDADDADDRDNAVETTTVPMTDDDADLASSEQEKND